MVSYYGRFQLIYFVTVKFASLPQELIQYDSFYLYYFFESILHS